MHRGTLPTLVSLGAAPPRDHLCRGGDLAAVGPTAAVSISYTEQYNQLLCSHDITSSSEPSHSEDTQCW